MRPSMQPAIPSTMTHLLKYVPIIVALLGVLLVALYHSSPVYAVVEHCGAITANETWAAADNVHTVRRDCRVTINPGVTLTIEAGAIIKLDEFARIDVDGTLRAIGTADHPISFTSLRDDSIGGDTNGDGAASTPIAGDWHMIYFNPASDDISRLEHAVIRYSGARRSGVTGNRVKDSAAITFDNASPKVANITFENNILNGVGIQGNQEWASDTWDNTSVVYIVRGGGISVPPDATLRIEPGMIIKFDFSSQTNIVIHGTLDAVGTAEQPIYFTSVRDDSIGGDTNSDEGDVEPATGDWGNIQFANDSNNLSSLIHVVIRYNGSPSETIFHQVIPAGAIEIDNASPILANISFQSNFLNGVQVRGSGGLESDIWVNQTVVYVIWEEDLQLLASSKLEIAPGMQIKLGRGADLLVDGTLLAEGTAAHPVFFSSIRDDTLCGVGAFDEPVCDTDNGGESTPAVGDWGRIQFNPGSDGSSISRAVIAYSGASELEPVSLDPILADPPLLLDNAAPTLANISFTANLTNGAQLKAPQDWATASWENPTVVYVVPDDIGVPLDSTLTITPGMKIKFGPAASLLISGTLKAEGTASKPISFSSIRDDTLCGVGASDEPVCDTDGAGPTTPAIGDWGGIQFASGSGAASTIQRAIIRYSGAANLDIASGQPVIEDAAIVLDGVSASIGYTTPISNYTGIEARNSAAPTLQCNDIYGNSNLGLLNATAGTTVTAERHWWGNHSGPTHASNPTGTGQRISDGIDFEPWAVEAGVSCKVDGGPVEPQEKLYLPMLRR